MKSRDPESLRLLFLIPRACGGKWAGKAWRSTSQRISKNYPHLSSNVAKEVLDGLKQQSTVTRQSNITKAVKKEVKNGFLRKASRMLLGDGLAPVDLFTIEKLKHLHPHPKHARNAFPGSSPMADLKLLNKALMDTAINKLPRDSAPGPSGWTFSMMVNCYNNCPSFKLTLQDVFQTCTVRR